MQGVGDGTLGTETGRKGRNGICDELFDFDGICIVFLSMLHRFRVGYCEFQWRGRHRDAWGPVPSHRVPCATPCGPVSILGRVNTRPTMIRNDQQRTHDSFFPEVGVGSELTLCWRHFGLSTDPCQARRLRLSLSLVLFFFWGGLRGKSQ